MRKSKASIEKLIDMFTEIQDMKIDQNTEMHDMKSEIARNAIKNETARDAITDELLCAGLALPNMCADRVLAMCLPWVIVQLCSMRNLSLTQSLK